MGVKDNQPATWIVVALAVIAVVQLTMPLIENITSFLMGYFRTILTAGLLLASSFVFTYWFKGLITKEYTLGAKESILALLIFAGLLSAGLFLPQTVTFRIVYP